MYNENPAIGEALFLGFSRHERKFVQRSEAEYEKAFLTFPKGLLSSESMINGRSKPLPYRCIVCFHGSHSVFLYLFASKMGIIA